MRICDECKKELTEEEREWEVVVVIHGKDKSKCYECCSEKCANKIILKLAQKVEQGTPVI